MDILSLTLVDFVVGGVLLVGGVMLSVLIILVGIVAIMKLMEYF